MSWSSASEAEPSPGDGQLAAPAAEQLILVFLRAFSLGLPAECFCLQPFGNAVFDYLLRNDETYSFSAAAHRNMLPHRVGDGHRRKQRPAVLSREGNP